MLSNDLLGGRITRIISLILRKVPYYRQDSAAMYLNVGCGPNVCEGMINLDYYWRPGVNLCWDLNKMPLPIQTSSLNGVYTEHCMEHLKISTCKENLKEYYRILKIGGRLRIVVPDAEVYFKLYIARKNDVNIKLPYQRVGDPPMVRINELFYSHGHLYIYDYELLSGILNEIGFNNVIQCQYRQGSDPRMLIDSSDRRVESLYLEATK